MSNRIRRALSRWGAFYGTELDLQLRRRGIDTILLAGISTNVGVESTARDAYERGYEQVFVEDAMAARNPDEHAHTVRTLFARIGRVRSTAEVLAALEAATGVARAVGLGSRTIHGVYLSPSTTTSNTTIPRAPTQPVSYRGPEGTCLRAQPNGVAGKKARHPATKVRALS